MKMDKAIHIPTKPKLADSNNKHSVLTTETITCTRTQEEYNLRMQILYKQCSSEGAYGETKKNQNQNQIMYKLETGRKRKNSQISLPPTSEHPNGGSIERKQ